MNFNIVDIIIVAVLGFSLVSGMYKGFIASGLTAVGFVGAWFGAMNFYPQLATVIMNNKSLMDVLRYYLDAGTLFKTPSLGTQLVSNITSDAAMLERAINELTAANVPKVITDAFRLNVTSQLFKSLDLNTFTDYLNQTIWGAAVNVLSFVIVFLVAYIVLMLIVNLLNSVFHFPLLRHFDWLLGGVFGLARGYVIMMLLLAIVPMLLSVLNMPAINNMMQGSLLMQYFPSDFAIPDIVRQAFQ